MEKPSAKLDEKGKLVTDKEKLKELYKRTYIERLSHRKMHPSYETIFELKRYLYEVRSKVTSLTKSPD